MPPQLDIEGVLRPGRTLTWRALTSMSWNPRSSSTHQHGFQYWPVASITTRVTSSPASQPASAWEPRGERLERPHLLASAAAPVGDAHAGHHLVLGDVQPGAARDQQLHRRHLPGSWVVPGRADRSGDAETRARSNSSWCREGPRVSLINGLSCTKESRAWPGRSDSHPSWRPPAMQVLSANDREPLCGSLFPQVVPDRQCQSYRFNRRTVMRPYSTQ
jgi:hypothetical protein